MSIESSLFGEPDHPQPDASPVERSEAGPGRLPDWQVKRLRRALDDQGLVEMSARQALVARLVGRPVDSLRDLEPSEALAVLERLAAPAGDARRTAWDDREADTWIDRL